MFQVLCRICGLLLLSVVVSATTLRAQAGTIRGTVVDSATGEPVPAVNVRIAELHRADLTHGPGTFVFERVPPGTYTLVAQRIGYRPKSTRVELKSGDVTVRIVLAQTVIQLTPSVVTGTLSERRHDEVLSPTSVLSGNELDRRLASTVAASLRNQPGVSVGSNGPATGRPVIRGLSGDRVLVLEDGQRPGDMSATSADHAVGIDPLTARQMEVVRGPMSLMYGSSALGGVVNVVRDEIPTSLSDRLHGALSAQGNSVNSGGTFGGYAMQSFGPLALRSEASARRSSDVDTPDGKLVNTGTESAGAAFGGSVIGDRGLAGFAYRYHRNEYGIPGGFVHDHDEEEDHHDEGVKIRMQRHALRAEGDLHLQRGPLDNVHTTVTYTDYHHTEVELDGHVGTVFDQSVLAAEIVARHPQAGPFALGAFGTRLQTRTITTGGSLSSPSTDDYSVAAFFVEEVGTGALRLQAGARWEWARYTPKESSFVNVGGEHIPVRPRTFDALSGSLGVLWLPTEHLRVGASVNRAFRTPDFNELYSDGPHLAANSYDVGDPSLKLETGIGVDAFVRLTHDKGEAEIAAFSNRLSDYIFPSSRGRAELGGDGLPRFQYTNEDVELNGVEGHVQWTLLHRVIGEATASLVQARFTSARAPIPVIEDTDTTFVAASRYPPLIPPLNGYAGLRWDLPQLTISGGARFAAEQTRTGDFETPTSGYTVADVSVAWRLLSAGRLHTFTLRVDNVFDRRYREHLSRIKDIMPEPGRDISLLYRFTF